jgi:hypothetical protein
MAGTVMANAEAAGPAYYWEKQQTADSAGLL